METIFKTRPNVPLRSLKCRDDCSIILAFKIDCRPKYDSSIEIEACCRAHLVWVKFQLNSPSCRSVHTLSSPVPCLAAGMLWIAEPPLWKPPRTYSPWASLALSYKLEQNYILENAKLQDVKFILPPFFPFLSSKSPFNSEVFVLLSDVNVWMMG